MIAHLRLVHLTEAGTGLSLSDWSEAIGATEPYLIQILTAVSETIADGPGYQAYQDSILAWLISKEDSTQPTKPLWWKRLDELSETALTIEQHADWVEAFEYH